MGKFEKLDDFFNGENGLKNIQTAQDFTIENLDKIKNALTNQGNSGNKIPLSSSETDVVFFGSLARNECTANSDIRLDFVGRWICRSCAHKVDWGNKQTDL